MMNKLFLIYIAFNLAVVYAQPTNESSDLAKLPKEQRQCAANKMMLKTLANLMEADKRGEVQNVGECSDLTGCLVTLAGTIAACAADLVDWPQTRMTHISDQISNLLLFRCGHSSEVVYSVV